MKLNTTPRHYMPLPQNQSDDDESGPSKEDKSDKLIFKNSFDACEGPSKSIRQARMTEVNPKNLPMSPVRLLMFIISLITCVLFVIIFVYCVPCTLPQNLNELCHLTYKWRKVLYNMSFTSPLDFVKHGGLKSNLIILGYMNGESGLIAIQESNGKEYWRIHLHSLPLSASCNAIDVDSDGMPECLVIGNNGLLTAIDVEKGISLWYLHNHSELTGANSINGPIIIPDCDDDGIVDIIISYNVGYGENSSHLALVSGGTGQIIGSLIELSQCHGPALVHFLWKSLQNDMHFVVHCPGEKNDDLWLLSSKDICNTALNETRKILMQNVFRIPHFVQDIQFYEVTGSKSQLAIVLDGIQFILLDRSQFNLQTVWKTYIEADHHIRILTDGQFMNGSSQLVITSSDGYHSKVMGLSLADGKEVWSILHDNGTVTSAVKIPNFFGNTDGLLLKILSSETLYEPRVSDENFNNTSSESNINHDFEKKAVESNLRLVQESYIFVKCGKVPVIKAVNEEDVLIIRKADGTCHPNVYTTNSTVLVKTDESRASSNILTVTSTVFPTTNSEEIIIKYFNLKNISTLSRCAG